MFVLCVALLCIVLSWFVLVCGLLCFVSLVMSGMVLSVKNDSVRLFLRASAKIVNVLMFTKRTPRLTIITND